MKRNLLIANIICLAAFFLVTLGMRNPSLDHTRGPKPRPRAVIEDVSKSPIAACCEQQLDAEVFLPVIAVTPSEITAFVTLEMRHKAPLVQDFFPSRASPQLLSYLS